MGNSRSSRRAKAKNLPTSNNAKPNSSGPTMLTTGTPSPPIPTPSTTPKGRQETKRRPRTSNPPVRRLGADPIWRNAHGDVIVTSVDPHQLDDDSSSSPHHVPVHSHHRHPSPDHHNSSLYGQSMGSLEHSSHHHHSTDPYTSNQSFGYSDPSPIYSTYSQPDTSYSYQPDTSTFSQPDTSYSYQPDTSSTF